MSHATDNRRWPVALATAVALCGLGSNALGQEATPPTLNIQDIDSSQQGQTPLSRSFVVRTHDEWVRDTRRKAWADTDWKFQARSFYMDRNKYDNSESEAWALGGSAGFKTGYFRERFALGATVYGSVPLYAPEDKDGTLLLKPGQQGYAVLGEAFTEVLFTEDVRMTVGARGFDTPYINRNDVRMTPNTFLAGVVQGLHGTSDSAGGEWRWGAGYFDKIKERNSDRFVPMSVDAGASVDRGVFAGGLNWSRGNAAIGAIDYWSNDIINIFYTEAKYGIPVGERAMLKFSAQYTDQASVGANLLTGSSFNAHQWGAKADLAIAGVLLSTGYTSAGGNRDMTSPWSGYPGYTSAQVEDFNRAGETAWLVRAAYTFPKHTGFSVYALYIDGSDPDAITAYSRSETDFNVQWAPPEGALKGLMVRLRYATVQQNDPGSTDLDDLRLIVYYDLPF